jgi:hypothetical protein
MDGSNVEGGCGRRLPPRRGDFVHAGVLQHGTEAGEVSIEQIGSAVERLLGADSVSGVLSAGWDAFELLRAESAASADRSADLCPAFTFARGAAVSGRNAIAFAPSMPRGGAVLLEAQASGAGDVYGVADAMAGLASALSSRLRKVARLAVDAGDHAACVEAAGHAEQIYGLLARGE